MLMRDVNDSEAALLALAAVLRRIQPDQVHIILPDRPPAEAWVLPADQEGLLRAEAVLGPIAHIVHPFSNGVHVSDYATPGEAIVGIVTRHPMSEPQLVAALDAWTPAEVAAALAELEQAGAIRPVERLGVRFWACGNGAARFQPKLDERLVRPTATEKAAKKITIQAIAKIDHVMVRIRRTGNFILKYRLDYHLIRLIRLTSDKLNSNPKRSKEQEKI